MDANDFTTKIQVDQSPEAVFNAITRVRDWWSEEIEGSSSQVGDVFNYHYQDIHRCKVKLIEVIPNQKIVWLVEENYFKFTQDKTEWTLTQPTFEITQKEGKTELNFTHFGLVPQYECFDICKEGRTNYIANSLLKLITTGKGAPNASDKPQTEAEKKLSLK